MVEISKEEKESILKCAENVLSASEDVLKAIKENFRTMSDDQLAELMESVVSDAEESEISISALDTPIEVAMALIQSTFDSDVPRFSVDELREISEYLAVYCKNHEGETA